jgi:4-hydroxybenzoate polyprenyltransferase
MRFDRPIGIWLLLWPTAWALIVAGQGQPSLLNIVIFTAGVVIMRAAGCVINDYADRDIDPHVERTRERPIAAGEISPAQALWLFVGMLFLALLLVLQTNMLTVKLALVGAVLAAMYPFCKRYTHLPQVVLGAAFGWAVPMAFAAETGAVPSIAWLLFFINLLWTVIYDTEYAMSDREDDLLIGVKSSAILFGEQDRRVLAVMQLIMLVLLVWFGLWLWPATAVAAWPWWLAVVVTAVLFMLQQRKIAGRERQACFQAFLDNNRVGLTLTLGLLLSFWLP